MESELVRRLARSLCEGDPDSLVNVEDGVVVPEPGPASERVALWTLKAPIAQRIVETLRPTPGRRVRTYHGYDFSARGR